jgi:hypothetical protein
VRTIKLSNAAFHQKVGSLKGGIPFLEAAGFAPSELENGPGAAPAAALVLPLDSPVSLLQDALAVLHRHCDEMQVRRGGTMPVVCV